MTSPSESCFWSKSPADILVPDGCYGVILLGSAATLVITRPASRCTKNMLNAAMDSITADELYEHVEVLADDVYEGRAAGSRGGHAAAQYIVKQLQQYPLAPAGTDGDYVQTFDDDWRNILVLQPGDDPQLEERSDCRRRPLRPRRLRHVAATAMGPIGKIHNGADDNASGVSMLLETIEAFAELGPQDAAVDPVRLLGRRRARLNGSRYWLAHPTLPSSA